MAIKVYSFQAAHMVVSAGALMTSISGESPGDDVFKFTRAEDSVFDEVGADGQMVCSVNTNKSGSTHIKLSQTSPSNAVLLAIEALAAGGPNTFVPVSVGFQDSNRQDTIGGLSGYIKKIPDISRGVKASHMEWEIRLENLDVILGNPVQPLAAQAAASALAGQ